MGEAERKRKQRRFDEVKSSVRRVESLIEIIVLAVIYYAGPTPAPEGKPIGSCGPTTSGRMDRFAPKLLDMGLGGMIGKGERSAEVREAIVRNKAVYFGAIGGAAALIGKSIVSSEIVAYEDLGAEAIRKIEVKDMPLVVIIDSEGNTLDIDVDDVFPSIEIYGQNEIIEIARDNTRIVEIAKRLIPIPEEIQEEIDSIHGLIVDNGKNLSNLREQRESNTSTLDEVPGCEEKLVPDGQYRRRCLLVGQLPDPDEIRRAGQRELRLFRVHGRFLGECRRRLLLRRSERVRRE